MNSNHCRRVLGAGLFLMVAFLTPQGGWGQICLDYAGYMQELGKISYGVDYSGEGHLAYLDDTLFSVYAGGLYAFDVSTPGEYELQWELGLSDDWSEDMALQGDHLFIVASDSLLVVRFQGIPAPAQVASLYHGGYAKKIILNGNYAYLSCDSYYDRGIKVVDITDPENPQLGTSIATNYAFTYMERDGQMLHAQSDGYAMFSFDLADPALPVEVFRNFDSRLEGAFDVTDSQAVLVFADTLRVMDVSNPTLPVVIGAIPFETSSSYGSVTDITLDGDTAFVLDYEGGMKSVDLTDPSNPELMGNMNTGTWEPVDLLVVGTTAHIGAGSGIRAVAIDNPRTPPVLSYLAVEDIEAFMPVSGSLYPRVLLPVGDVLYLGEGENFAIFNVANPVAPQFIGYTQLPYTVQDIRIDGLTAYAACSRFGVQILDISQPATPTVTDAVYAPGDARALCLSGNLLYVACDEAGLTIIDISTPGDPSILSWVNTGGRVRDVEVVGDLAFLVNGDVGLMVYDVTDPSAPVLHGVTGIPDSVYDLIIRDDYAYVWGDSEGVWVIDITDPAYPEPMVSFGDGGATALSLHGNVMYVADWSGSTSVYNITDPLNASCIGATATIGGGGDYQNVALGDGLLFQAGYDGLAIVLPQCAINPGSLTDLPERVFLSHNYPNPFNPRTTIYYELTAAQPVTLRVYDVAGRLVQTLVSGETKSAGPHETAWLGKDDVGRSAAAGVYLYELVTPDIREVRRMTLLK